MKAANKILFNVSKDFSKTPGPRYPAEGDFSGETFREKYLEPLVKKAIEGNAVLLINLDGTAGYGTSFLEESFGGLIRINRYALDDLLTHLEILSDEEPYLIEDILQYLKDSANESK